MPWTETARREYRRDNRRYASDLTERDWAPIAPFLPPPKSIGRPSDNGLARGFQRHPVYGDNGMPVGSASHGLSALFHGPTLLLRLAG